MRGVSQISVSRYFRWEPDFQRRVARDSTEITQSRLVSPFHAILMLVLCLFLVAPKAPKKQGEIYETAGASSWPLSAPAAVTRTTCTFFHSGVKASFFSTAMALEEAVCLGGGPKRPRGLGGWPRGPTRPRWDSPGTALGSQEEPRPRDLVPEAEEAQGPPRDTRWEPSRDPQREPPNYFSIFPIFFTLTPKLVDLLNTSEVVPGP